VALGTEAEGFVCKRASTSCQFALSGKFHGLSNAGPVYIRGTTQQSIKGCAFTLARNANWFRP